jgi:ATP-dependent RNA helicase RhlE
MKFSNLGLSEALQHSIEKAGYKVPTPIQTQAIPTILAGEDLIASAQTGTGKTAAFALPILHKLSQKNFTKVRPIRALVVTPTRELASQVGASFKALGAGLVPKLRTVEVFGGVKIEAQEHKLKLGCDILIATPGRLIDLIGQKVVRLDRVELLVLDEGDRLMEMGFMPDIKRICAKLPETSQRMMFSATFSEDVDRMSAFILRDAQRVAPETSSVVVAKIRQIVHAVHTPEKVMALRTLLEINEDSQVLVFVNTRAQAADLSRSLSFASFKVGTLHGDVDQKGRAKVLADFLSGAVRILVATDVAARGLHIPELPLVVNYELPTNIDDYVHRIGRTGRVGKAGRAVSLVAPAEMVTLEYIEELIGETIERQKIPGFKVSQESPRKRKEEILGKESKPREVRGARDGARPRGGRGMDPRDRTDKAPRAPKRKPVAKPKAPVKTKGRGAGSKATGGARR